MKKAKEKSPSSAESSSTNSPKGPAAGAAPWNSLTRVTEESAGLPMQQRRALVALAAGQGFTEAARTVGVSRQAIYRWRHEDARFAAILNAWQNATIESVQHRLLSFANDAVATVGDAITSGDVRTALTVLKGLGMLSPVERAPTKAADIARDRKLTDREEYFRQVRREQYLKQDAILAKMSE